MFLEGTLTVSMEKSAEVFDASLYLVAAISLRDEDAVVGAGDDLLKGDNIGPSHDGIGSGGEGLVLDEVEALAVVDEGVAGDARGAMIGMSESAINDEETPVCLDGVLALSSTHGDVAIDNVAVTALDAEMIEDVVDDAGIVTQEVIMAFRLLVRRLVFNEVSLESSHLALIEEGAIDAAPKVPKEVAGGLALVSGSGVVVSGTHYLLDAVHKIAASEGFASNVDAL